MIDFTDRDPNEPTLRERIQSQVDDLSADVRGSHRTGGRVSQEMEHLTLSDVLGNGGRELVAAASNPNVSEKYLRHLMSNLGEGFVMCADNAHEAKPEPGWIRSETWPQHVLDLAHRLRTQDNHCTASPLYLVQAKKILGGLDLRLDIERRWTLDGEYLTDAEVTEYLELSVVPGSEEFFAQMRELSEWTETRIKETWIFVSAHFTEDAANTWIAENQHRYRDGLRVYVDSQYQCHEFNALIEWLKGLGSER